MEQIRNFLVKRHIDIFNLIFGSIVVVFSIVGIYVIYDEYQAGKNCLPYQLERNHPYGDPPWVSCTDGVRVWAVDRKK